MPADVREAALRLLDYQDRSEKELRERLLKKDYPEEDVDLVIRSLKDCGLLDDRRYAELFARSKLSSGKGRVYIFNKLRKKGIPSEISESVMAEVFEEQDEKMLCLKKALAICGLSSRFEISEDAEIVPIFDSFDRMRDDLNQGDTVDYFEPEDERVRCDRQACRTYREKAKAKLVRRLISAGFSAGIVFDTVKKIERL